MKNRFLIPTAAALLALTLTFPVLAGDPSPGAIDFGRFVPPSDGGQFVEVNIKSGVLGLAARLTEKSEPEVASLLRGLKAVRVNVIGLDDGNRGELRERIDAIRHELDENGWERLVTVREKKEDVGVYLKHRGEEAIEGVVVTVINGNKEAVFINVVGDIRPEKIAEIGEKLGIDPLKQAGISLNKS